MNTYFHDLNYSCANEDTSLEFQIADKQRSHSILSIGGSGARCLPFLSLPIKTLHIVDVSQTQILFIKFKLETIKQLEREECINLWTTENQNERLRLISKLKLEPEIKSLVDSICHRTSLLFCGRWEKTFIKFSKLAQFFFSHQKLKNLFYSSCPHEYFSKYIQGFRWNTLLKIVGNKATFNSLLYKGNFIKKNSPLSYFDYYQQAFERLVKLDIKKSHFLQICLLGNIHFEQALPIEFSPELFPKIKSSPIMPTFEIGDIFQRNLKEKYDFISLSDVPSYLQDAREQNFLQILSKNLMSRGLVIGRYYLRTPENINIQGLHNISAQFSQEITQELVQMYKVQIFEKC